jgi:hypothetical protein
LPFLRYTRDKRGYETTALVHASRRHGRARQRILYWFRTPPGVKVGRPALDEEAIRWIEEHNPEIQFNWPKILEAQPPPAAPVDNGKNRRRRERSDRGTERRRAPAPSPAVVPQGPLEVPESAVEPEPVELSIAEIESDEVELPAIEDALEQLTHADAEEHVPPTATPVDKWIAREQLIRLRARYAELQARITERGGDAGRIEALRAQAELLNPDAWVTEEEARKGLEEFETRIRDLRAALGLRRRRRSRRGGRRQRRKEQGTGEGARGEGQGATDTSDGAGEKQGATDEGSAAIRDDDSN